MTIQQKEDGFSLLEVIASIVIVSIILLSFSQFFIQTNKIAHKNHEKLTTVNLADAMLARLKADSFDFDDSITDVNAYFKDTVELDETKKNPPTKIIMNNKTYTVSYDASQKNSAVTNSAYSEKDLNLIKVVVTVTAPDGKTKGSSEGYVALE